MQGVGTGRVIAERYALDERRAHLGELEVWLATDATLARQVYVTVFPMSHPHAEAILDAGRRCAAISDARLVRVYDVGVMEGSGWLVEESLADSTTLTELLQDGPLQSSDARRIVGEVCEILQVAATRGLHHLHLSPHAVRLTKDGRVKVAGIAIASAIEGTLEPSAPEASRIDARGALAIGYAALTTRWPLQPPVPGLDSAPSIVGGVAAPSEIAVDVPADLDALCRATFTAGKGPASPVELAARIAPWHPARSALVDAGEATFASDNWTATGTQPVEGPTASERDDAADATEVASPGESAARPVAIAGAGVASSVSDPDEAPAPDSATIGSFADRVLDRGPRAWIGKARQRRQLHPQPEPAIVGGSSLGPGSSTAPGSSTISGSSVAAAGPSVAGAAVAAGAAGVSSIGERAATVKDGSSVLADSGVPGTALVDGPPVVDRAGFTEVAPAETTPAGTARSDGVPAGSPGQAPDGAESAVNATSEGQASAVAAKVGSFARAAADRAAQSAATARQTWAAQRAFREQEASGPTSSLDAALDTASTDVSEGPYLLEAVTDTRDGVHSRFVLGMLAGLIVLALLIALPGLFRSPGGSPAAPEPTASAAPAKPGSAPAAPAPAAPSASSAAPIATGATLALASASGFDPDGDKRENDAQAPLAIDGDPATSWKSEGYLNGPAIAGKKGVGVIVTLAKESSVSAVTLTLPEEPQDVSVYLADRESLDGAQLLGTAQAARGSAELSATSPLTGRYIIVWFTKAAPDNRKYRAWLAELSARE